VRATPADDGLVGDALTGMRRATPAADPADASRAGAS
jgi:hypothetical protein